MREGLYHRKNSDSTLFFVDLEKKGKKERFHFDDFFQEDFFHWDSQTTQHINSPKIQEIVTGKRIPRPTLEVTVEPFENIFDAIKRELEEELSIEVTPIKKLLEYNHKKYNLCFIECTLGSNEIVLNEHLSYAWVRKQNIGTYDFIEGDNIFINSLLTKP